MALHEDMGSITQMKFCYVHDERNAIIDCK